MGGRRGLGVCGNVDEISLGRSDAAYPRVALRERRATVNSANYASSGKQMTTIPRQRAVIAIYGAGADDDMFDGLEAPRDHVE